MGQVLCVNKYHFGVIITIASFVLRVFSSLSNDATQNLLLLLWSLYSYSILSKSHAVRSNVEQIKQKYCLGFEIFWEISSDLFGLNS